MYVQGDPLCACLSTVSFGSVVNCKILLKPDHILMIKISDISYDKTRIALYLFNQKLKVSHFKLNYNFHS